MTWTSPISERTGSSRCHGVNLEGSQRSEVSAAPWESMCRWRNAPIIHGDPLLASRIKGVWRLRCDMNVATVT